jgi:hypothetical protein
VEPPAPYTLVFAAIAHSALTGLPVGARRDLADRLETVLADPWTAGQQFHPRWPPEVRTSEFGFGGLVQYVVSDKQRRVIILQVTFIG